MYHIMSSTSNTWFLFWFHLSPTPETWTDCDVSDPLWCSFESSKKSKDTGIEEQRMSAFGDGGDHLVVGFVEPACVEGRVAVPCAPRLRFLESHVDRCYAIEKRVFFHISRLDWLISSESGAPCHDVPPQVLFRGALDVEGPHRHEDLDHAFLQGLGK